MAKQYYLPTNDMDRLAWLQNFAGKLPNYKIKYGISDAEVQDMVVAAAFLKYWLEYLKQFTTYKGKITAFKNELITGIEKGSGAAATPVVPPMPAPPAAAPAGIFVRATALVAVIKGRTSYSEADGIDLGIEGAENTSENRMQLKPSISINLVNGGHPEVVWKKNGMSGIDIYVKRSDTDDWTFLATDTIPNYIDSYHLPESGKVAVWKYKAIYREDDEQSGDWSDEVNAMVKGM